MNKMKDFKVYFWCFLSTSLKQRFKKSHIAQNHKKNKKIKEKIMKKKKTMFLPVVPCMQ